MSGIAQKQPLIPPRGTPAPGPPGGVDLDAVRALVEPLVAAHVLELCDVEWTSSPHGKVLRVTIDSDAGIKVEDCVRVSRDLSTALDVSEIITPAYSLEVSSPGLDRPLRTLRDFSRQIGRLAKVKLKAPAHDGQHVLRGTIVSVQQDDGDSPLVNMEVDGNPHAVVLDNIREAKLVFELGNSSKATRDSRKRRKQKHR